MPGPYITRRGRWTRRGAQPEPKLPLVSWPPAFDQRWLENILLFEMRFIIALEKAWVAHQKICVSCAELRLWKSDLVSFDDYNPGIANHSWQKMRGRG